MIFLFRTSECAIGGACKTWIPHLKNRYGNDVVEIVDMNPHREHMMILSEAMAKCIVVGGDPNDMPWIYDTETRRIGRPRKNGKEGIFWE